MFPRRGELKSHASAADSGALPGKSALMCGAGKLFTLAGSAAGRLLLAGLLIGAASSPRAWASAAYSITPTVLSFGNQSTSVRSQPMTATFRNTGTTSLTITSFSISPSEFQITAARTMTMTPGGVEGFSVAFAPDAAQTFTGQLVINVSGFAPIVVTLTGTGFVTGAVAQASPSSLSFSSQAVGTSSAAQTVTISNVGTTAMTVQSVTSSSPFFTVSGLTAAAILNGGQSLQVSIAFSPTAPLSYTGTVDVALDVLPDVGVSLSGTGTPATSLTVDTLAKLPAAVQNAAYLATMTSAGGAAPYTWQLAPGSILPAGLSLSSSGTISGSIASGVAVGNYAFTVQASDSSSPPATASEQLTLPVVAPTGASCNNIYWDVAGTTAPLVAVTDLGTGTYFGTEGGLYPNGSNVRPADHDAAGVSLAKSIQPLDANGNPDPNGKYVLLSIGISSAMQEFNTFTTYANDDAAKNPHLVIVNGAQPAETTALISSASSPFWATILDYLLPYSNVTANQVVAVWIEDVDPDLTGAFPGDMTGLQSSLETLAQTLLIKFPNVKLAYLSSRMYTGYSNGISANEPEPYSYEFAFAARGAIEDQLNGDPALNFDPTVGPVMAPWLAWGPYYWTNGLMGRSDGMVWSCADSKADGYHPSDPAGRLKVVDPLLNFFKTDDTAAPWFTAQAPPPVPIVTLNHSSLAFGDQNLNTTSPSQSITLTNTGGAALSIASIAASGDYAATNTCGTSVAAGASCNVFVTFTPTVIGTDIGTLTFSDNASDSPETVSLSGTGINLAVTLSPTSLTFSTRLVGTTSAAENVTLTNTGSGTVSVSSISLAGKNPGDFGQTNTCGTSLAAGTSCTISITFSPSTRGLRTASLSITDNAGGSPQSVALTGGGTYILFTPASLNFGSQALGTTSPAQTVTMTNTYTRASITISSITLGGPDYGDYAQTNNCGASLGVGASCTITVTFTPKVAGTRTAGVSIVDNGGGSPQTIPLAGSGT